MKHRYLVIAAYACCFPACFFLAAPALAGPPYRCDGRVQMRPCGQPFPGKTRATELLQNRANKNSVTSSIGTSPNSFAKIISKSLTNLPKDLGLWKGRVEGNGDVHLTLKIFRDGQLESSRYMGAVKLINKSTAFAFKSTLPSGPSWTWDVVATAL